MKRTDGRVNNEKRPFRIIPNFMPNATGSCLVECGNTRVLVTASATIGVPKFLEESGKGWVTAEYAMLPGATPVRKQRERLKADSRSIEIGRLIGRSLRAKVDFEALDGVTIHIDCDVIQADGGTRTASITGGFVALALCCEKLLKDGKISRTPLTGHAAAISAGIVQGEAILDLCYEEDSAAEADFNFVGDGENIIEIGLSGEKRAVTDEELAELILLCKKGTAELIELQKQVLGWN